MLCGPAAQGYLESSGTTSPFEDRLDKVGRRRESKYFWSGRGAGLLRGAYHYAGPLNVDRTKQADFFLDYVEPEEDEFLCFDCEKHGTLANMEEFSCGVRDKAGRHPAM